ncbi:hypothetical protein QFX18_04370 [Saccharophagus degradans]|uniref:hypothetical protein n=1 Tax=Saccharophagus degradans TaxID=86304 RepID=UPI002477ED9A|nr:hypothetical protein [Saccharophagus degradans]WGO99296.1 hypothetical protein QFX18_04370 [Saccharophagus degradans]
MDKIDKAKTHLAKATQLITWMTSNIDRYRSGVLIENEGGLEKELFSLLTMFDSLRQSVLDCAKCLGEVKLREVILDDMKSDTLLRYLKLARDSEIHCAVEKWSKTARYLELKIVDPQKVNSISGGDPIGMFLYLFDVPDEAELGKRMMGDCLPSFERCHDLGVKLTRNIEKLLLMEFETKVGRKLITVDAPTNHMGEEVEPNALNVMLIGLNYLKIKADYLVGVMSEKELV